MTQIRIEKVRLGRTNLIVTKLGWGGIPIQRVSEEEAVAVVGALLEMGVEVLDTARAYTNSEHRIGLALRKTGKPAVLSTKSTEKTEKIYEDVLKSLRQLKVRAIPIYHIHNVATFEDYEKVLGAGGAYRGLKRARDQGLIAHIGMTSHNLQVLERAIEDGYFDVVMACYSFLESEAAHKVFPLAKAKDIGVLAMKVFSGGVIEEAGPALRFALQTKEIVPIPGSETMERARENWKVFTEGGALTAKDQEYIETIRKQFNQQFCRRCDYCQPCSEGINIQFVVGLKSVIKRLGHMTDEVEWISNRVEKARNCSECGDCLPRCPYRLPIPALIKENLIWYDRLKEQKKTA